MRPLEQATYGLAPEHGASAAALMLVTVVPLDEAPRFLFDALDQEKSGALMAAMDACNSRFGRGAVVPAWVGLVKKRT